MKRTASEHYKVCEQCLKLAIKLRLESMIRLWKSECEKYAIQMDTYAYWNVD